MDSALALLSSLNLTNTFESFIKENVNTIDDWDMSMLLDMGSNLFDDFEQIGQILDKLPEEHQDAFDELVSDVQSLVPHAIGCSKVLLEEDGECAPLVNIGETGLNGLKEAVSNCFDAINQETSCTNVKDGVLALIAPDGSLYKFIDGILKAVLEVHYDNVIEIVDSAFDIVPDALECSVYAIEVLLDEDGECAPSKEIGLDCVAAIQGAHKSCRTTTAKVVLFISPTGPLVTFVRGILEDPIIRPENFTGIVGSADSEKIMQEIIDFSTKVDQELTAYEAQTGVTIGDPATLSETKTESESPDSNSAATAIGPLVGSTAVLATLPAFIGWA